MYLLNNYMDLLLTRRFIGIKFSLPLPKLLIGRKEGDESLNDWARLTNRWSKKGWLIDGSSGLIISGVTLHFFCYQGPNPRTAPANIPLIDGSSDLEILSERLLQHISKKPNRPGKPSEPAAAAPAKVPAPKVEPVQVNAPFYNRLICWNLHICSTNNITSYSAVDNCS